MFPCGIKGQRSFEPSSFWIYESCSQTFTVMLCTDNLPNRMAVPTPVSLRLGKLVQFRSPAVRQSGTGAGGPTVLHKFFYFSVI